MNTTLRRLQLAIWAARNADVLTMLHYEMMTDARTHERRHGYKTEHSIMAAHYARRLDGMPGAEENRAEIFRST